MKHPHLLPSLAPLFAFSVAATVGLPPRALAAAPIDQSPATTNSATMPAPSHAARYPAVPGKSIVREDEYTVAAPPAAVFPLLCPSREYEWLPGWNCELLRSTSGVAEHECVFRTVRADSGTMTWVVTRYEPPRCIEFTCFNTTEDHVMRLGIQLDPTPNGGTRLRWRRHWIVTGPAGDKVVDQFNEEGYAKLVRGIESLMKYFLEHGHLPPPEPAKP